MRNYLEMQFKTKNHPLSDVLWNTAQEIAAFSNAGITRTYETLANNIPSTGEPPTYIVRLLDENVQDGKTRHVYVACTSRGIGYTADKRLAQRFDSFDEAILAYEHFEPTHLNILAMEVILQTEIILESETYK